MKKNLYLVAIVATTALLSACGGEADNRGGAELGKEVCDCYREANQMKADDPSRKDRQKECQQMQNDNYEKIKDKPEEVSAYNAEFKKKCY